MLSNKQSVQGQNRLQVQLLQLQQFLQLRQWKSVRVAHQLQKPHQQLQQLWVLQLVQQLPLWARRMQRQIQQCCQVMGRHQHRLPCFHPRPWGDQCSKQLLHLPRLNGQEGSELLSVTAQWPHVQCRLMEGFPPESLRNGPMNTA